MKRLILLVSCLLFQLQIFSQVPSVVHDPTANKSLVAQLAQGAEQLENGMTQIKLLEDSMEVLNKINSALDTVNYLTDIAVIYRNIIENVANHLREVQSTNQFSSNEMTKITGAFRRFLSLSSSIFTVAENLMTEGIFKMNDSERLTLLKECKRDARMVLSNERMLHEKYMNVANILSLIHI